MVPRGGHNRTIHKEPSEFGKLLRDWRHANRYELVDVSLLCGVTDTAWNNYEIGRQMQPSVEFLLKVAAGTELPLELLEDVSGVTVPRVKSNTRHFPTVLEQVREKVVALDEATRLKLHLGPMEERCRLVLKVMLERWGATESALRLGRKRDDLAVYLRKNGPVPPAVAECIAEKTGVPYRWLMIGGAENFPGDKAEASNGQGWTPQSGDH